MKVWLVKNRNGAYIDGTASYSHPYPEIGKVLAWTDFRLALDYACRIVGDLVEAELITGESEYKILRVV